MSLCPDLLERVPLHAFEEGSLVLLLEHEEGELGQLGGELGGHLLRDLHMRKREEERGDTEEVNRRDMRKREEEGHKWTTQIRTKTLHRSQGMTCMYIFVILKHTYIVRSTYLLDLLLLVELALCLPCEEVVEGAPTLLPLRLTHTKTKTRDTERKTQELNTPHTNTQGAIHTRHTTTKGARTHTTVRPQPSNTQR